MKTNSKILEKIKKCLALSKSSNANEAAAALRQAQKLMQQHNINSDDVELSSIKESQCAAGNAQVLPRWHSFLASTIEKAFGVKAIYSRGIAGWIKSRMHFIGVDSQPEIAGYAYEVLLRQVKKERAEHVKKQTRCKAATKTRRGDLFAESWVYAVHSAVVEFAQPDSTKALIQKHIDLKNPNLTRAKIRSHSDKTIKDADFRSADAGYEAGKKVQLNRAMNGKQQERLSREQ